MAVLLAGSNKAIACKGYLRAIIAANNSPTPYLFRADRDFSKQQV
jgi:hypothetical protein